MRNPFKWILDMVGWPWVRSFVPMENENWSHGSWPHDEFFMATAKTRSWPLWLVISNNAVRW